MHIQWQESSIIRDPKQSALQAVQCDEEFGYLMSGDEQIYVVRHPAAGHRIGQVLLAGCYAFRRERAYISWVRWARFLARHGLEVLRFDYRGAGESTGDFVQMDFDAWLDDTRCCARWLRDRGDGCPLVLHGFELGALLTCRVFDQGIGDALLAWSPPASAREMLCQALYLHRIQQYAMRNRPNRVGGEDLIAELEAGRPIVVGGCTLSPRLWEQSPGLVFAEPQPRVAPDGAHSIRPCRVFYLDPSAGPLCMSGSAVLTGQTELGQLNPDLTALFQENLDWIRHSLIGNGRSLAIHPAN